MGRRRAGRGRRIEARAGTRGWLAPSVKTKHSSCQLLRRPPAAAAVLVSWLKIKRFFAGSRNFPASSDLPAPTRVPLDVNPEPRNVRRAPSYDALAQQFAWSLFNVSACIALCRSGPPGAVRRAAPDWPSGHAVQPHAVQPHATRGRWRAAAAQPEGLSLWAHGAASSLGRGPTSTSSLLLAPHAHTLSAVHAETLNRLLGDRLPAPGCQRWADAARSSSKPSSSPDENGPRRWRRMRPSGPISTEYGNTPRRLPSRTLASAGPGVSNTIG